MKILVCSLCLVFFCAVYRDYSKSKCNLFKFIDGSYTTQLEKYQFFFTLGFINYNKFVL